VLLVSEILGALLIGREHRDVVVRETAAYERVDALFSLREAGINSEY
jgi:hypothetical protein